MREARPASPRDVRLLRHRPKETSLHALSTRRETNAGPDPLPSLARNRPPDRTMPAYRFNKSLFIGAARRRELTVWGGPAVLVPRQWKWPLGGWRTPTPKGMAALSGSPET